MVRWLRASENWIDSSFQESSPLKAMPTTIRVLEISSQQPVANFAAQPAGLADGKPELAVRAF